MATMTSTAKTLYPLVNGFALGLGLRRRLKATRKCAIALGVQIALYGLPTFDTVEPRQNARAHIIFVNNAYITLFRVPMVSASLIKFPLYLVPL